MAPRKTSVSDLAGTIVEDVEAENRASDMTISVGVIKSNEFSRTGTNKIEEEMKGQTTKKSNIDRFITSQNRKTEG